MDNNITNSEKERYGLIDFLRGITLISMIVFHACWDLQYIFGVNMPWYTGKPGFIWERSICLPFIFMSGFCILFGRSRERKIKRGLLISICGALVSFVSIVFMDGSPIYFGVLTFIGFAMILFALLENLLTKCNPYIMILVNIILGTLLAKVSYGYIGIKGLFEKKLPEILYRNMFTTFFGFPFPKFSSSDYFAILPWIFVYGAGFYSCLILKNRGWLKYLTAPKKNIINLIGRHTLPIYMLHQPVIYGLLMVIFRLK